MLPVHFCAFSWIPLVVLLLRDATVPLLCHRQQKILKKLHLHSSCREQQLLPFTLQKIWKFWSDFWKNSPLTIQTFLQNLYNLNIFKTKMMCFLTNFFKHNTRWQFRNWEDASSIAKKSICHVLAFAFLACLFFVLVVVFLCMSLSHHVFPLRVKLMMYDGSILCIHMCVCLLMLRVAPLALSNFPTQK